MQGGWVSPTWRQSQCSSVNVWRAACMCHPISRTPLICPPHLQRHSQYCATWSGIALTPTSAVLYLEAFNAFLRTCSHWNQLQVPSDISSSLTTPAIPHWVSSPPSAEVHIATLSRCRTDGFSPPQKKKISSKWGATQRQAFKLALLWNQSGIDYLSRGKKISVKGEREAVSIRMKNVLPD